MEHISLLPGLAEKSTMGRVMKVTIPEELKKDVPTTTWGKVLSATPVVMAVIATMLAGLASSEMTRAQYDRALAAQQQSKAGDQWSFFQAKRLRGAYQRNTADLLQAVAEVHELDAAGLRAAAERLTDKGETSTPRGTEPAKVKIELLALLDSNAGQEALARLKKGELPAAGAPASIDPRIKSAIEAVDNLGTDAEIASILAGVDNQGLEAAVRAARDQAQAFDTATKPLNQTIDRFETLLDSLAQSHSGTEGLDTLGRSLNRDFTAARLGLASQRYEVEARLNQAIANLYELQVRKSNLSAERHHARSQRFFFGMLAAQLGVIISTFAIAARQRNLLWSLAAVAGLVAVGFAIYVYLKV
jgi:hypothetical protein